MEKSINLRKYNFLYVFVFLLTVSYYGNSQTPLWATFDASDSSYVDFGLANNLTGYDTLHENNYLSVALWARWGDKGKAEVGNWANMVTMTGNSGSGDDGIFWFQHNHNNTKFEFAVQTDGGRRWVQGTTNPNEGQWYFISGVYNGSTVKIYVDGVLEGTKNRSGDIADFESDVILYMGMWANSGNNNRKFDGDIDEVSIWNKELSSSEINSLMSNPESVLSSNYDTTGLLGYWNFDDGTANDLTPNGNNGTNGGGVTSGGNPLPVELLSFTGKLNNSQVDLEWETASELNNDYFTVEYSSDGVNFEPIDRIDGKGNYNGLSKYNFTDFNPLQGVSYYRLKQTDFDGKFEYSDIISITYLLNTPAINSNMTLYPNPAQNGSDVKLKMAGMPADKEVLVVVTSVLGQQMYSKVILTDNNGNILYAVDPYNQLPSGTYIIVASSNDKLLSKRLIISQ